MDERGVEPDVQVVLQVRQRRRGAQPGSGVADTGVDRVENRGDEPIDIGRRVEPAGRLLRRLPVVDRQEMTARQVLIDHFGEVMCSQFDDREDFGHGQAADGILRPG